MHFTISSSLSWKLPHLQRSNLRRGLLYIIALDLRGFGLVRTSSPEAQGQSARSSSASRSASASRVSILGVAFQATRPSAFRYRMASPAAAAAADIRDRAVDIGVGRLRLVLEQRRNRQNHAALAIAALRRPASLTPTGCSIASLKGLRAWACVCLDIGAPCPASHDVERQRLHDLARLWRPLEYGRPARCPNYWRPGCIRTGSEVFCSEAARRYVPHEDSYRR
jgi:hypothetical protein